MTTWTKPPVLGIDLGTSSCLTSVCHPDTGALEMIKPDKRLESDLMPSVFCPMEDGRHLVGHAAYEMLRHDAHAANVVRCVKRYMREPHKRWEAHGASYSPTQISAIYLGHLRRRAEEQLKLPPGAITQAVVTVPAYFGLAERHRTLQAAQEANLQAHLLDEPIAAAYGLGLDKVPGQKLALVVDLGGGTLDVTLVLTGTKALGGGLDELGRDGDATLGGDRWDEHLAKHVVFSLQKRLPHYRKRADFFDWNNSHLYHPIEQEKCVFSTLPAVERKIEYFDRDDKRIYDLVVHRDEFFRATDYLAERCVRICERLLENIPESELGKIPDRRGLFTRLTRRKARLGWADIDRICLVGGGSRMRQVIEKLQAAWGRPLGVEGNPQHQIVRGAALIGARLHENQDIFEQMYLRCPHAVGYLYTDPRSREQRFQTMLERNRKIPDTQDCTCPLTGTGRDFVVTIAEERLLMRGIENETERKVNSIGELRLVDLPPRKRGQKDEVKFTLHYSADGEINFTARVRGEEGTVNIDYSGD